MHEGSSLLLSTPLDKSVVAKLTSAVDRADLIPLKFSSDAFIAIVAVLSLV
jgi:hypothetical protein